MNRSEVVALMQQSKNQTEWDKNRRMVKKEYGGYPEFWYSEIIASMLFAKKLAEFKENVGK